jgi:trans-AT polyketide synthase/acyltransferase/oxidoreductase domain-containing protein
LETRSSFNPTGLFWQGDPKQLRWEDPQICHLLQELDQPAWLIKKDDRQGIAIDGQVSSKPTEWSVTGHLPPIPLTSLGDPAFRETYQTKYSFYTGAMANGIASEALVIALAREGMLGTFGTGGVSPQRAEIAILKLKEALPSGPFAFNLLNSPNEPAMEERTVALFLKHQIRVVEASAYLALTVPLVHYRVAGLSPAGHDKVRIENRVIAKLSRLEVAQQFLQPAPEDILEQLLKEKKISPQQAQLARHVPIADDITVEADSGGHTDNRPLVCMLPAFLALRDTAQAKYSYAVPVRVGAAGGIGTPEAALAAFMLGAAYIATGSINQACVESGTSEQARKLLTQMEMADVSMAPASDMFEMGVKVQVLKRGTMFSMRAQKLYELYTRYNSWEEVPEAERDRLEKTVFKRDFDSIWTDTAKFFTERDPRQIERANANPRDKMALVFRWYLGLSSRWAINGEKGRELDYQIWAGPSLGAFNGWVRGTYLESASNRRVADINLHILRGCAYLYRLRMLEMLGLTLAPALVRYTPERPLAASD